jgi:hypothetical protein
MSEAKFHSSLSCPNGHGIPIPRPTLSGTAPSHLGIANSEKKAVAACPECGLVPVYADSSIHAVLSPRLDPFEAQERHLVFLEMECDDKTHDTPTAVHTIIRNR